MARKKRGNAKSSVIQETLSGESSSAAIRPTQRDAPHNSLGRAEPSQRSSSGFFQGSAGVEVNGGRFNQTYGHQTNVTIHVNGQREEDPELLQHHPQASTSQLPAPVDPSLTAHPPVITRISYTPDNSNKIYERHLALKKRGFPLWIPEPNSQLPMSYRRRGIQIGDVGIITPSGGFSFLFNICRPPGDPINPSTLPEGFSPIYPPLEPIDVRRFSEFKSDSYLASGTIERVNNDPPFPGLSFQMSANEGAILTIPEGAVALDLENVPRFRAYAAANIENWYRYVNGPRGREAKNGEVRLVIGCDKTTSWGMAAVANVSQHKTHYLKFRAMEEASATSSSPIPLYRWEYSGMAEARVGPDLAEIEELKRSDDSEEPGGRYMNQCLFVRTLNLTLNDDVFEALNRDVEAALIEESLRYQRGASHTTRNNHVNASIQSGGSTEPSGMQSRTETQRDSSETSSGTTAAIPQVQDQRVVTSVSPSAQKFHPADFLNKAILKKAPHSRLAITQDVDWYSVFTEDDECMPPPEEIATRVLAAHYIREEDGVAYLEPRDVCLLSPEHIEQRSTAKGKFIAAADYYTHHKIISEQLPASLEPAKKKLLAANDLEPLVTGRESRPETADNSDEADDTSADVTTDHEEQPQERTESAMPSLDWESDVEDIERHDVQLRRTHSSYYPAQVKAGKKRADLPQQQDLPNALTLDLKGAHDDGQRELFVKLPPSSYQDPAKSRGGGVGLLTKLMKLDPRVYLASHSIRRPFNFKASSTQDKAPALPDAQIDPAMISAMDTLQTVIDHVAAMSNPAHMNSSSSDDYVSRGSPKEHPVSNDVPPDSALVLPIHPQIDSHSETPLAHEMLGMQGNLTDVINYPYVLPVPALPSTPRTTRRNMLSTEMPESLRRNLLWVRQLEKPDVGTLRRSRSAGGSRNNALGPGVQSQDDVQLPEKGAEQDVNGMRDTVLGKPAFHSISQEQDVVRGRGMSPRNKGYDDSYHLAG